jgi:hypothetical protein
MTPRLSYMIYGYAVCGKNSRAPLNKACCSQAVVVQIVNKDKKTHLASIIKGQATTGNQPPKLISSLLVLEAEGTHDSPWFVFNDFVVRNISEEEALSFPDKWKVRLRPGLFGYLVNAAPSRFPPSSTWSELTYGTTWTTVVCPMSSIPPY